MAKRALLLLSLAVPAWAAFDAVHWRWSKPFSVAVPGPARVRLDAEVLARARADLADLRVSDSGGVETPYALESGRPKAARARPARLYNLSRGRPGDTVFELDLGPAPEPHDAVTLDLSGASEYRKSARVEASDDARSWRAVQEDGILIDFHRPLRVRHSELSYPESRARYLRVTIFETEGEPTAVLGASVRRRAVESEEEALSSVSVKQRRLDDRQSWELDLGAELPVEKVRILTGEKGFKRRITVSVPSEEGDGWERAAEGAVYCYRSGATEASSLDLAFPERRTRRLKIELYHYDDQPLPVSAVDSLAFMRRLRLKDAAPGAYALHYGNPRAKAPRYDLTALGERPEGGEELALGPAKENEDFSPERGPWSEEHPWLLGAALLASVGLLGGLVARRWKTT